MNWLGNQSAPSRIDERIQDLLDDARAARQLGDWKLTQSLVNAVLALDPMNTEASGLVAGSAPRRQMTLMFRRGEFAPPRLSCHLYRGC